MQQFIEEKDKGDPVFPASLPISRLSQPNMSAGSTSLRPGPSRTRWSAPRPASASILRGARRLGLETNFANPSDLSTIRCLATLAYAHYRGDCFRREPLDALDILQQGHVAPEAMRGSWAARWGRRGSCPRPSSASPSTSTSTAARTCGVGSAPNTAVPDAERRSRKRTSIQACATSSLRPGPATS